MKKCLLTKSKKVNKGVTRVTSKWIPTKKQLKIIKEGWKQFQKDYDTFMGLVFATEKWMRKETGIKGLEFIHDSMCMGWIGVGTFPPDMKLLHGEDL